MIQDLIAWLAYWVDELDEVNDEAFTDRLQF